MAAQFVLYESAQNNSSGTYETTWTRPVSCYNLMDSLRPLSNVYAFQIRAQSDIFHTTTLSEELAGDWRTYWKKYAYEHAKLIKAVLPNEAIYEGQQQKEELIWVVCRRV